jgi:hypothetical protein
MKQPQKPFLLAIGPWMGVVISNFNGTFDPAGRFCFAMTMLQEIFEIRFNPHLIGGLPVIRYDWGRSHSGCMPDPPPYREEAYVTVSVFMAGRYAGRDWSIHSLRAG